MNGVEDGKSEQGQWEKAMKGKDEESGLEKRQNREVGQRQTTSVFCVWRDVPMYSCSKRWGRLHWMTALMQKKAKSYLYPLYVYILIHTY